MSSSDFTLSSDWDLVESIESSVTKSEDAASGDLKEKEGVQKGSCVHDISEQEINKMKGDSRGPDLIVSEVNNPQESSSSEFDVIEETIEDSQDSLSFSHMEYSISSSLESSHPSLAPETRVEEVEAEHKDEIPSARKIPKKYSLNVHPVLLVTALFLAVVAVLLTTAPFSSVRQIKDRIIELKAENDELKNLVQSKLENDRLLIALEEQIKALKTENLKLSDAMKALVAQLEDQTALLKKDKETAAQDPYRKEIEKLKEQINILQIDNEELQKQLVRTRYGIYSPHSEEPKADPQAEEKQESKDKADQTENRDNTSEILLEEINELRKKLYSEVEKLKNWKESVQHIVNILGHEFSEANVLKKINEVHAESKVEKEKQSFKSKESFDHSKSSAEKERFKKSKPNKEKRFSDWSWKGMKKNLKDTFEGLQEIDVPNMISSYVDKKKIDSVFESVGVYFKKAQEKTKKVLNLNDDINQEMWHFLSQLRNQWHDMRDKFFQKNYPAKQAPPTQEDHKSQFSKRKLDAEDFEAEKKFNRYQKQGKPEEASSDEKNGEHLYPDMASFTAFPSMGNEKAPEEKEKNGDNSWVFKRAAHRSQLREEEQEAFTNWFLKRGRDFHYNEDESLKEWLKETYQNGIADEE